MGPCITHACPHYADQNAPLCCLQPGDGNKSCLDRLLPLLKIELNVALLDAREPERSILASNLPSYDDCWPSLVFGENGSDDQAGMPPRG